MKLRGYQEKATIDCTTVLLSAKPNKSAAVLPTGAGKSIIIAETVKYLTDGNVLVVQPSKELLKQNYKKFIDAGGEASIYSASMKSKKISKVTYATDMSLKVEAFRDKNIKYLILDECHLKTQSGSKLNSFIRTLKIDNVLGLTATPVYLKSGGVGTQLKMLNRVKGKLFNDICHVTQIKELVDDNYWSKLVYDLKEVDESNLEFNTNGSDYTQGSLMLNYEYNNMEQKIISSIEENPDRKSILIFVPTVSEAIALKEKISGSEVVYSGMNDKLRDEVIQGFLDLKIRVVINVNILSVGFDHPRLDYIITARPTASIAVYYQQLGRGVRLHDDKEDCKVTDLSGNVERFGVLEKLTFDNIEGYGWGMFSEDRLLSAVPFWEDTIPTKQSLLKEAKKAKEKAFNSLPTIKTTFNVEEKIWFGKYKDKTCKYVANRDPRYIAWMLSNKEWDWTSKKMSNLKGILLHLMREKVENE